MKDALWSAGGHLAALAWVATRAFAGTVFVSTAAGVVLGALSWAALWDRPWGWGPGMAALAVAEGVAAGVLVGLKRAGILAAAHALGRLKLGGRLVRAVFDRMLRVADAEEHGERGVLAAKGLERVPLARADALLTGAVKAVAGEGEGGWVRRKVRGALLGTVQTYTAARFREEGARHGGVDLIKVRDELEQSADAALLARVRGGLRTWTLVLLLGLPAVVAVQTALVRYATAPPLAA